MRDSDLPGPEERHVSSLPQFFTCGKKAYCTLMTKWGIAADRHVRVLPFGLRSVSQMQAPGGSAAQGGQARGGSRHDLDAVVSSKTARIRWLLAKQRLRSADGHATPYGHRRQISMAGVLGAAGLEAGGVARVDSSTTRLEGSGDTPEHMAGHSTTTTTTLWSSQGSSPHKTGSQGSLSSDGGGAPRGSTASAHADLCGAVAGTHAPTCPAGSFESATARPAGVATARQRAQ